MTNKKHSKIKNKTRKKYQTPPRCHLPLRLHSKSSRRNHKNKQRRIPHTRNKTTQKNVNRQKKGGKKLRAAMLSPANLLMAKPRLLRKYTSNNSAGLARSEKGWLNQALALFTLRKDRLARRAEINLLRSKLLLANLQNSFYSYSTLAIENEGIENLEDFIMEMGAEIEEMLDAASEDTDLKQLDLIAAKLDDLKKTELVSFDEELDKYEDDEDEEFCEDKFDISIPGPPAGAAAVAAAPPPPPADVAAPPLPPPDAAAQSMEVAAPAPPTAPHPHPDGKSMTLGGAAAPLPDHFVKTFFNYLIPSSSTKANEPMLYFHLLLIYLDRLHDWHNIKRDTNAQAYQYRLGNPETTEGVNVFNEGKMIELINLMYVKNHGLTIEEFCLPSEQCKTSGIPHDEWEPIQELVENVYSGDDKINNLTDAATYLTCIEERCATSDEWGALDTLFLHKANAKSTHAVKMDGSTFGESYPMLKFSTRKKARVMVGGQKRTHVEEEEADKFEEDHHTHTLQFILKFALRNLSGSFGLDYIFKKIQAEFNINDNQLPITPKVESRERKRLNGICGIDDLQNIELLELESIINRLIIRIEGDIINLYDIEDKETPICNLHSISTYKLLVDAAINWEPQWSEQQKFFKWFSDKIEESRRSAAAPTKPREFKKILFTQFASFLKTYGDWGQFVYLIKYHREDQTQQLNFHTGDKNCWSMAATLWMLYRSSVVKDETTNNISVVFTTKKICPGCDTGRDPSQSGGSDKGALAKCRSIWMMPKAARDAASKNILSIFDPRQLLNGLQRRRKKPLIIRDVLKCILDAIGFKKLYLDNLLIKKEERQILYERGLPSNSKYYYGKSLPSESDTTPPEIVSLRGKEGLGAEFIIGFSLSGKLYLNHDNLTSYLTHHLGDNVNKNRQQTTSSPRATPKKNSWSGQKCQYNTDYHPDKFATLCGSSSRDPTKPLMLRSKDLVNVAAKGHDKGKFWMILCHPSLKKKVDFFGMARKEALSLNNNKLMNTLATLETDYNQVRIVEKLFKNVDDVPTYTRTYIKVIKPTSPDDRALYVLDDYRAIPEKYTKTVVVSGLKIPLPQRQSYVWLEYEQIRGPIKSHFIQIYHVGPCKKINELQADINSVISQQDAGFKSRHSNPEHEISRFKTMVDKISTSLLNIKNLYFTWKNKHDLYNTSLKQLFGGDVILTYDLKTKVLDMFKFAEGGRLAKDERPDVSLLKSFMETVDENLGNIRTLKNAPDADVEGVDFAKLKDNLTKAVTNLKTNISDIDRLFRPQSGRILARTTSS